MSTESTKVYTVTQLTRDIRGVMENVFGEVWVEGEVSNFIVSSAGHTYFSIKDENSLLNCVMFKFDGSRVAFTIENGLHILCCGRISIYDKRGQYQLYVKKVEPRGRGALQLAFEQLKTKLHKEGLFDESQKKPLPFLPEHVGIVTSATGAAIKDILKVARRRFANIKISICPVRVQGAEAKDEISRAIGELNEYNRYAVDRDEGPPVDVIIIGRGGGSLEDLWPFNEEIVARAIYASEIPVVSAVGHEIDYTISDFTADLRAPTPSAAAELVIPLKDELAGRIKENCGRMHLAMKRKTDALQTEIVRLRGSYVLRAPMNVFLQMRQQLDDLSRAAAAGMAHIVELKQRDLTGAAGKLRVLSPLAVLERGYSITFKEGKVVKDLVSLREGDLLKTKLASGEVRSRIESTENAAVRRA